MEIRVELGSCKDGPSTLHRYFLEVFPAAGMASYVHSWCNPQSSADNGVEYFPLETLVDEPFIREAVQVARSWGVRV